MLYPAENSGKRSSLFALSISDKKLSNIKLGIFKKFVSKFADFFGSCVASLM
jgi:hypothetical protein